MCRMLQSKTMAASPAASVQLSPRLGTQHHTISRRHWNSQSVNSAAVYQQPVCQDSQFGHVQAGVAQLPRQDIGVSREYGATARQQVELSLQVTYKCTFGQRLAVVGSFQAWQTVAALPMTWQAGDIWSAVLSLPSGCNVEYKYVVTDQHGQVVRWQEGGNNKLGLHNSGFLLHVTDSWAHETRQVHEIGVPAPSQLQQQRRAAGNHNSRAAAASGQVLLQNNITAFSASSNVGRLQQADQVSAVSAAEGQQPPQVLEQRAGNDNSRSSPAEPDPVSKDVAAILPLLQTDLASALDSLATNYPNGEQAPDDLLAEGRSVLQVLQLQLNQEVPPLPAELLLVSFDEDSGEDALELLLQDHFADVEAAADAAAAALEEQSALHNAAIAGFAAAAEAAAAASNAVLWPSSSGSGDGNSSGRSAQVKNGSGSRSPSGSPASSLASASEDEIAAALLSDDCEEACCCLVDAICSCMGSEAGSEACEVVYFEEHAAVATTEVVTATACVASAIATPTVAAKHAVPVEELVAQQPGSKHTPLASVAPAALDLHQLGCFMAKQGSDAARAAAFAGVQQALQESAELLERLSDPTHPLLLQADRQLADASRQMGNLLAA